MFNCLFVNYAVKYYTYDWRIYETIDNDNTKQTTFSEFNNKNVVNAAISDINTKRQLNNKTI